MSLVTDNTVFDVLAARELRYAPSASTFPNRAVITWEKRAKVMEWLTKVHSRLDLPSDTLWLAQDIFHRFISTGEGPTTSAYHTGLTSLWLAAKVEDRYGYRLRHFARHIDGRHRTQRRMVQEEAQILAALQFRLSGYVPPTFWVGRISGSSSADPFALQIALVLIDTTIPEPCFATFYPKELAATAVLLAGKMQNRVWTAADVTVSGFEEGALRDGANLLLQYLRSDDYVQSWMYRKYGTDEHVSLGHYVRVWALEHAEI
ncbi:hypothetical protein CF326_g7683 [Tilletia indica]|nr:hypothetical protein CF326_g7683 [Tilletia indica]